MSETIARDLLIRIKTLLDGQGADAAKKELDALIATTDKARTNTDALATSQRSAGRDADVLADKTQDLSQSQQSAAQSAEQLAQAESNAGGAMDDFNSKTIRGGLILNDILGAAHGSSESLQRLTRNIAELAPSLAKGTAVMAAFGTGWKAGAWIDDVLGLSEAGCAVPGIRLVIGRIEVIERPWLRPHLGEAAMIYLNALQDRTVRKQRFLVRLHRNHCEISLDTSAKWYNT
jgi:hypothetical protein